MDTIPIGIYFPTKSMLIVIRTYKCRGFIQTSGTHCTNVLVVAEFISAPGQGRDELDRYQRCATVYPKFVSGVPLPDRGQCRIADDSCF